MAGTWQVINGRRFYDGDEGIDTALGTAEDESMFGKGGDDNLNGGAGNDAIDGGFGNDNLIGGDGDDRLWDYTSSSSGVGIVGRDRLLGGNGDDHLNVWSPDTGDTADGGAGFDLLEVRFNYNIGPIPGAPPVVFTLVVGGSSVIKVNDVNTVAVNNIERLLFVGNNGADFITAGVNNDTLAGNDGNDVLRGGGGDDWLDSGTGVVNLDGGLGKDRGSFVLTGLGTAGVTVTNAASLSLGALGTVKGVEILDNLVLTGFGDTVALTQAESAGIDVGLGDDRITGTGALSLLLGGGNDRATLGGADDDVDPGTGADVVDLGGGNDSYDMVESGSRTEADGDSVTGGAGNDQIYTSNGADVVDGGADNDTLYGGGGADSVLGGLGNDSINGEGGADTLRGGAGNDRITTDYDYWTGTTPVDNDRAFGEAGDDFLSGGIGSDTLDGGLGNDTVSLALRTDFNSLTFDPGPDSFLGGGGIDVLNLNSPFNFADTVGGRITLGPTTVFVVNGSTIASAVGFERLDVSLYGTGGHSVTGGVYADRAVTSYGNDSLVLGGGDDYGDVGRGADTVNAGAGNDTVLLTLSGPDRIEMGEGDDSLTLYGLYSTDPTPPIGASLFDGGTGTDTLVISGGARGVSFSGTLIRIEGVTIGSVAGFERIQILGSTLDETVGGSAGNDTINPGAGNDSVNAGAGDDSIDGGAGNDSLLGGTGNDTLVSGPGADTLNGGLGDDRIVAVADTGADSIVGGTGFDTLLLSFSGTGNVVMSGNATTAVTVSLGGTTVATLAGIEVVTVTGGAGNDSLLGVTGNDSLDGGAGNDTLRGGAGDDTLVSFNGQGVDVLDGGAGAADLARINRFQATTGISLSVVNPAALQTLFDGTRMVNVERIEFVGGSGNDTLTGGALADVFSGNLGNDSLVGGAGNDTLEGGGGIDTLRGGVGDDSLSSFDGGDVLDGGAGGVDVLGLYRFGATVALSLDLATAALQTLADGTKVVGFERAVAFGGSGNDNFSGGTLADNLGGNDGNDSLVGGTGDDSLFGGGGLDRLVGGVGNDSLAGGADNDTLTGNAGADRFRFDASATGGIDRISDFTATDALVISRFGFGLPSAQGITLVANANPVPGAGQSGPVFLYDTDSGLLAFDSDGAGAALAVGFAVLRNGAAAASLTAGQFLLE